MSGRKGGIFSRRILVWAISCPIHIGSHSSVFKQGTDGPNSCAAHDLLLLHSHDKHSWDPQEPPLLRTSSLVLALPSCPEIPNIVPPMPPGIAGDAVRDCRLCDGQTWSSSSAVTSSGADALQYQWQGSQRVN